MLTKETVKGMKKAELIKQVIADQNRLEYLKDKVEKQAAEVMKYKAGLDELKTATEILLKTVAIEKGTDVNGHKEIWISRRLDVSEYEVKVDHDPLTEKIGIKVRKT